MGALLAIQIMTTMMTLAQTEGQKGFVETWDRFAIRKILQSVCLSLFPSLRAFSRSFYSIMYKSYARGLTKSCPSQCLVEVVPEATIRIANINKYISNSIQNIFYHTREGKGACLGYAIGSFSRTISFSGLQPLVVFTFRSLKCFLIYYASFSTNFFLKVYIYIYQKTTVKEMHLSVY